MTDGKSGRGGARQGAGRKLIADEPMSKRNVRMTDAEWRKVCALARVSGKSGASAWIRDRIKHARLPEGMTVDEILADNGIDEEMEDC